MSNMRKPTTHHPDKLYTDLDEKCYKAEFELLDRYHAFSAELLRLSLLGIAVFGFLFKETFLKIDWQNAASVSWYAALGSILFLFLASASALAQRLLSTDAARYFVYGLRLHANITDAGIHQSSNDDVSERDSCLRGRRKLLKWSLSLKYSAVIFLGLGTLCLGLTLWLLLAGHIPLNPEPTK